MNRPTYCWLLAMLLLTRGPAVAQHLPASSPVSAAVEQQVNQLSDMVAREQEALDSSQRQIAFLRKQIAVLQGQLAGTQPIPLQPGVMADPQKPEDEVARLNASVENLRERQDVQQSELATHEQAKVESESKFPVKVTGLILMNAFSNSAAVDVIQSPALALGNQGTTGLSLRQTVLGLDARGPHVFGGASSADVRVDFFAGANQGGYTENGGVARLRTAHADVAWDRTRAFVAYDRPIVSPNVPSSLTAVAQPALAWSGNLWNWMPQVGGERTLPWSDGSRFSLQAAIADVPDAATLQAGTTTVSVASLGEQSRWPGSEARVGYGRGDDMHGMRLGIGGYFSPHTANSQVHFDAWAATADYRIPLSTRFEASGSLYRGAALGGLGGGAYKDYVYVEYKNTYYFRPLDDVGGWAEMKARATDRIEFNAAYGIDNAFAHEIRPYLMGAAAPYQSLARNATVYTNVIYSPTAYTLFSLEYRRIDSSYALGPHAVADIVGVAAGYRF